MEPEEIVAKPLRFVVQDTYSVDSVDVLVGRVESGTMTKGDELVFQPSGLRQTVEKIVVFPKEVGRANPGDSVGVVTGGRLNRGDVGGHPQMPPLPVRRFLGEVVLLEGTMHTGDEFELKCGTKKTRCLVENIRERISSETGEVIGQNPSQIRANEAATVIFSSEPMVVEKFYDIPELGRFVLVRDGKNVGAGIVLEPLT